MKLALLYEGGRSREFSKEIKDLLRRRGPRAVRDEYGISGKELDDVLGAETYGTHDVQDKIMHKIRAPQKLYKLMQYFGVNPKVISRIVKFYKGHRSQIEAHPLSPPNKEALRQLNNDERLAILWDSRDSPIGDDLKRKYYVEPTPIHPELYYISRYRDVIKAMSSTTGMEQDLLHGLTFGYPWADVFNFVRFMNPSLVDNIVGEDPQQGRQQERKQSPQSTASMYRLQQGKRSPSRTVCTNPNCPNPGENNPGESFCGYCGGENRTYS